MSLQHPCLVGVPKWEGIEMATLSFPSRRSIEEQQKWLHHSYLLGVPNLGRNRLSCKTVVFLESPKTVGIKVAASLPPSQGPQRCEESKWLYNPGLVGVPNMVRNQTSYMTIAFLESPAKRGIKVAGVPLPSRGPKLGKKAN